MCPIQRQTRLLWQKLWNEMVKPVLHVQNLLRYSDAALNSFLAKFQTMFIVYFVFCCCFFFVVFFLFFFCFVFFFVCLFFCFFVLLLLFCLFFFVFFFIFVFFLTNYRSEMFICKLKDWMSNRVDLDETAHYEQSHLDLCCLQKPIIVACSSETINHKHMFGLHWAPITSSVKAAKIIINIMLISSFRDVKRSIWETLMSPTWPKLASLCQTAWQFTFFLLLLLVLSDLLSSGHSFIFL